MDYSQAFHDGQVINTCLGELVVSCCDGGDLVLPTGQIVACDPIVCPETQPFTVRASPGSYPVLLSIAHIETDQRVAAAMVRFSDRQPVRWDMALLPDEDVNELDSDAIFGYDVDSGEGCFMDVRAARVLVRKRSRDNDFFSRLMDEMRETYVPTWSWLNKVLDAGTGANLVTFSTGCGDGRYASYFGYTAKGKLVCLVTDFFVK